MWALDASGQAWEDGSFSLSVPRPPGKNLVAVLLQLVQLVLQLPEFLTMCLRENVTRRDVK